MNTSRKAFLAQSDAERRIVFARGHAEARRIDQGQRKIADEQSVRYRRAPAFDRYAERGSVPARELRERYGWAMHCQQCGQPLPAGKPSDSPPVYDDDWVFCSDDCRNDYRDARDREHARTAEAIRQACARWPGIVIEQVETAVEPPLVRFSFPGGAGPVLWQVGDAHASVRKPDAPAWIAFEQRIGSAADRAR